MENNNLILAQTNVGMSWNCKKELLNSFLKNKKYIIIDTKKEQTSR